MRHAYLIMAHNEFEILEKLLILLDNPKNDIYLHIDKKIKNFDFQKYQKKVLKANLIFTKRMDIRWGSEKQIKCTLMLLKEATKTKHKYYHFLSGVDLPLKNQDEIHNFFSKTNKNFIEYDDFDSINDTYLDRIKYYHLCQKNWRSNNKLVSKISNAIRFRTYKIQKHLKINRLKNIDIQFRKGANWFSINEETAKYILEQNHLKYYKHSYCADELYIQTIIYNSKFKKSIYFDKTGKTSNLRYIDWNKGNPAILKMEDYDDIVNSNMLFARKFSYKTDKKIIEKIFNNLRRS